MIIKNCLICQKPLNWIFDQTFIDCYSDHCRHMCVDYQTNADKTVYNFIDICFQFYFQDEKYSLTQIFGEIFSCKIVKYIDDEEIVSFQSRKLILPQDVEKKILPLFILL